MNHLLKGTKKSKWYSVMMITTDNTIMLEPALGLHEITLMLVQIIWLRFLVICTKEVTKLKAIIIKNISKNMNTIKGLKSIKIMIPLIRARISNQQSFPFWEIQSKALV